MADNETLITLTADIVASYVSHNRLGLTETPELIRSVHDALKGLDQPPVAAEPEKSKGAVSIRASVKHDGLISMIDGRKYQTLRRHIAGHGYTPETYRETFGLARDYPMVSTAYSETRRAMAKKIGLGRKRAAPADTDTDTDIADTAAATTVEEAPKPARRGRGPAKPKAAPADAAPAAAADAAPKRRGRKPAVKA